MKIFSAGFNKIRHKIIAELDIKVRTDCNWLVYNKSRFEVIIEIENEVGRQIMNQLQTKFKN